MSSQQFGSFVLRTKIAYSIPFSQMNVKELDISLLHKMLYFFHCICVSSLKNLLRPLRFTKDVCCRNLKN